MSERDISEYHTIQENRAMQTLLERTETKLEVATKIMQELMVFKQWVDHVYPNAVKEYDAVMAVSGEVIHIIE